jgi:hypothetical protein
MGTIEKFEEMITRAGDKIEFAGVIYLNEPQGAARLLGVIADHQPSNKPVLVLIDDDPPSIPRDTRVVVRGRLAPQPYASPG